MKERYEFGFGCLCRDDSRCACRAGWRGTQPGNDSQRCGVDPQADEEAWSVRAVEGLLGGGGRRVRLYWQLTELGIACEVIAPTLVPMKAGDRVGRAPSRLATVAVGKASQGPIQTAEHLSIR